AHTGLDAARSAAAIAVLAEARTDHRAGAKGNGPNRAGACVSSACVDVSQAAARSARSLCGKVRAGLDARLSAVSGAGKNRSDCQRGDPRISAATVGERSGGTRADWSGRPALRASVWAKAARILASRVRVLSRARPVAGRAGDPAHNPGDARHHTGRPTAAVWSVCSADLSFGAGRVRARSGFV